MLYEYFHVSEVSEQRALAPRLKGFFGGHSKDRDLWKDIVVYPLETSVYVPEVVNPQSSVSSPQRRFLYIPSLHYKGHSL